MQRPEGVRALSMDRPIGPARVERYLRGKFGEGFAAARRAMEELAAPLAPADLAARAYYLYERFRPDIPAGVAGWGAAGVLDVAAIAALAGEE